MNTTSFDYAVLSDSVARELESLRAEKQELSENLRKTQTRLAEISLQEEKLARFSESLNDLLTPLPSSESLEAARRLAESGKTAEAGTSPAQQQPESSVPYPNSKRQIADSSDRSDSEFNKSEFLKLYPHLRGAQQPIHILAEKLLEYIGRPTKLRDLTNYILELGYRHSSQNFTNTVHTVLKLKRDRNGNFYFDPKERMWELGSWRSGGQQSDNAETDKTSESNSEMIPNFAYNQTSQKSNKNADETNKAKPAGKIASTRKIKIIKAARR